MKCYYQQDFICKLVNHWHNYSLKPLTLSKTRILMFPGHRIPSKQKLCVKAGGNSGQL